MRALKHRNLISLHEVYETDHSIYMVMEILEGGNLKDCLLGTKTTISKSSCINIMMGILKGLIHMHKKGIMHRDLKPENILFRNSLFLEDSVCLADFGLASYVNEPKYLFFRCGTPGFVAPEILNNKDENAHYTEKCDIFSLGVILHIL